MSQPETKASRRKANYRTIVPIRAGVRECVSRMIPETVAAPVKPTRDWITCKQDEKALAEYLKGGAQ